MGLKVWLVNQSSSDQAFDKVKQELSENGQLSNYYPHQKFVYFVVFEGLDAFGQAGGVGGQFGPSGGMALLPRGVGNTDALNFDMSTIAHELGHAFGLDHDFRSTGNSSPPAGKHYVMSYDRAEQSDYVLSNCNADYLAVDRYFNRSGVEGLLVEGTYPKIKINTPLAYASGANEHRIEFELSDPEGLHQVQFSVITDVPEGINNPHEVANDSPQIQFCQLLSGVSLTTDYLYATHLLAISGSKSITSRARRLHIKIVDKSGQESYKNFTIYDQDRSAETHTLTNGSLGELLKVAWPKDIISISGTPVDTGSLFIENGLLTLTSANPNSPQSILARLIIDGAADTHLHSLNLTGISLQSFANNVVIEKCIIESTGIAGVYIDGESSTTLVGNTIQNCSEWGVYVKPGSLVTVGGSTAQQSNTVQNNDIGIQLEGAGSIGQPVSVTGNNIQNNLQDGIVVSLGSVVSIGGNLSGQANSIINNQGTGISLFGTTTHADVTGNIIRSNQGIAGIYVGGGNADISGNTVEQNLKWGIYGKPNTQVIVGGSNVEEGNTIQNNDIGIQLEGVGTDQNPASITGNVIQNNTETGIALSQGTKIKIGGATNEKANSIINNGGIGIALSDASTNAEIINNIIKKNEEGIRLQGAKAQIDENLIEENDDWGIYVFSAADAVAIDRNIITKNKGGIFSFEPSHPVILRGNLITRCTGSGNEAAVWLQGAEGTLINNTIANNNGYGLGASFDKPLMVANTIFAQNQKSSLVNFQGNTTGRQIIYSLFDGNNLPFGVSEISNLNGNPQFVSTINDDYHLQSISAAINTGDSTVSDLPIHDLDGNQRIFGSTIDIGAYEYGSSAVIRQLAFTSQTQSVNINQDSTKITVQLQDQDGSPINSTSNLIVTLSSSSTTGILSTSAGGTGVTSVTINAGQNQADFYYRDTNIGNVTLTATAPIGSPAAEKSATQNLSIVDLIPPSISSQLAATLSPVEIKANGITIQFSKIMNTNSGNIKLVKSGEQTQLNVSVIEWDAGKQNATINLLPNANLIAGEDYTISLTDLLDTAGNGLVSDDQSLTFQTISAGKIIVSTPIQSGQRSILHQLKPINGGGN